MTWNNQNQVSEPKVSWGGAWTEKKLAAFSKYVWSYLTIMKKYPYWETIYFDGFVGSGSRKNKDKEELFTQLSITEEEVDTYTGAAERVLNIEELGFNYYYFIDNDIKSLSELEERLNSKFKGKELIFRPGDANKELKKLANAFNIKKLAALVLLDPFGMQLNWESIESLKGTRSDVWILIPSGVIINRLLDRKGELKFSDKLECFFGLTIEEIKQYFYTENKVQTLFGMEDQITKVSEPIKKIATLYANRMKTIWDFVTEEPLVLHNKTGAPIFHFVFASNNKHAYKIAKDIIKGT